MRLIKNFIYFILIITTTIVITCTVAGFGLMSWQIIKSGNFIIGYSLMGVSIIGGLSGLLVELTLLLLLLRSLEIKHNLQNLLFLVKTIFIKISSIKNIHLLDKISKVIFKLSPSKI